MKKTDEVIHRFQVAWIGWEMDNLVEICKREDNSLYIRMTNHGKPYEANIEELEDIRNTYVGTLQNIEKGLQLIRGEK